MARDKWSGRKPDGKVTRNMAEYADAWRELAAPLERALGARLFGFDPTLSLVYDDGTTSNFTVKEARLLGEALTQVRTDRVGNAKPAPTTDEEHDDK